MEDIITRHVASASPSTTVADVLPRMAEAGVHHLPVVGEDARLVGVVTQTDLVAALLDDLATRADRG